VNITPGADVIKLFISLLLMLWTNKLERFALRIFLVLCRQVW